MSCTERYASAQDFISFWCIDHALDGDERARIEGFLDITASDIHAARAASGGCDCALAGWAETFLQKLNLIEAAVFYMCPCASPRFTDDQRGMLIDWASLQLDNIRLQNLELCAGHTGAEFPAFGFAEVGWTTAMEAQIIANREQRRSG